MIGLQFNGTTTPIALGYLVMGSLALGCVLIAENGRLFGVGKETPEAARPPRGSCGCPAGP